MPKFEIDLNYLESIFKGFKPEMLQKFKCSVEKIEGGKIFLENTSDRIDLFSAEGLARALKNLQFLKCDYEVKEAEGLLIKVSNVESRPFIVCGAAKGISLNERSLISLIELQERLSEIYGRKRSVLAIGLHDMDKIKFPLTYEEVPDNTSFIPLKNNAKLTLKEIIEKNEKGIAYGHLLKNFDNYPVIRDASGEIISFPPIINSKLTELSTNTKNIFIDVTGNNERMLKNALGVLLAHIKDLGAEIYSLSIEKNGKIFKSLGETRRLKIEPEYVNSVLGYNFSAKKIAELLERAGFKTKILPEFLEVEIPIYRADILGKIDLVEEVAITHGYENFEPEVCENKSVGEEDKLEHFKNVMREIFIGYGYQEVQTPILISQDLASLSQNIFVKIKNAVSENFSCVRSSLIPSLIDFLKENTRATYPQKIFECGDVVVLNKKLPEKTETLGFLSGAYIGIDANFSNIKGEIIGALESLGIKDLEFKSKKHILFLKGRCASIRYRGEEIGFFGEIHPKILSDFELFLPTAVFEINLNAIF